MKKFNRVISSLLAVIMMLGTFSLTGILQVGAAEEASELDIKDYLTTVYNTPEDKLATMTKMLARDGFELYVDAKSGEVATLEVATGNILFSNPYDIASSTGASSTKEQILSQIAITYTDNGQTKYMYSYKDAALLDQIAVMKIKNGVRVEYTMGRENNRKLVPRWILSDSFDTYIRAPLEKAYTDGDIDGFSYDRIFKAWYSRFCIDDYPSMIQQQTYIAKYPILEGVRGTDEETGKPLHNILYVLMEDMLSTTDLTWMEDIIKTYCEDYTYEQMDADHEAAGYEMEEEQFPVFKMALEYTLDANGMSVRLPCNGLRYDMSTYTLENLSILPYMGAGNNKNAGFRYEVTENGVTTTEKTDGFNFFPDGAGSLFDFEKLNTPITSQVRGKVYGLDFAYHQISGVTYQKNIRYPVYGSVASEVIYNYSYSYIEDNKPVQVDARVSNTVMTKEQIEADLAKKNATLLSGSLDDTMEVYHRGYVAIIEEGDSLAELSTYHAGSLSSYSTMLNYFNPKPKDSYDLSDALSVGSSSTMTVVSDRKYTGSLTLRYVMLCDDKVAEDTRAEEGKAGYTHYPTTWLGMAEAYRDTLCANGTLTQLTAAELEKDIPLYIESFGALETLETVATIPVWMMTALTTFDQVKMMYDQLAEKEIKNINFKLTGFANGGMYSTMPYHLDWESVVGGEDGLRDLINEANTINEKGDGSHLGLYPDFDFAYINATSLFDGVRLKDDAVKAIDERYTSYRQYSATYQAYESFYQLAIAPSRYSKFYNKLLSNYEEYGLKSMSVGSLGNTLNSDFNEDAPLNREDSKEYTKEALAAIKNAGYSLMSSGGNAYTWQYIDHLLNVDLDSSRYVKSSASVPFIGAVLHGYVQFAGTPFNEEGDTDYAILRAIENGAGLYFLMSYQNTDELKEDYTLSQNYSIRYDIWLEDVVSYYNRLNGLLKDVQSKVIIGHEFLMGERVLDLDELETDIAEKLEGAAAEEDKVQTENETADTIAIADAWASVYNAEDTLARIYTEMVEYNRQIQVSYGSVTAQLNQTAFANKMNAVFDILSQIAVKETAQAEGDGEGSGEEGEEEELPTYDFADKTVGEVLVDRNAMEVELEELGLIEDPDEIQMARIDELKKNIAYITDTLYVTEGGILTDSYEVLTLSLSTIRTQTISMLTNQKHLVRLMEEATELVNSIDGSISLIATTPLYNDKEDVRAAMLTMLRQCKEDALVYMSTPDRPNNQNTIEKQFAKYANYFKDIEDPETGTMYPMILNTAFNSVNNNTNLFFEEGGAYAKYKVYQELLLELCEEKNCLFTKDEILALLPTDSTEDEDEETDESGEDHYLVDNNRIVVVTYGDRDFETHKKTPYKSFILNYNTYAVRVTYEGVTYTIASGAYVVVHH